MSFQRFNTSTLQPYQSSCSGSLIISLHDVSPQTQEIVAKQLEALRALGVARCSLLVIPDYHHHGSITRFPGFVTWLQEQAAQGHEIVLHGYHHLRSQRTDDRLWKRWITEHYTAGEGEFYDLGYEEARTLLQKGKQELVQAGCDMTKVTGFIAPAWLLGRDAERAVVDEGFSYTTRLHGVIDLREQPSRFFSSQSMVYSVRSAWRRAVSLGWNELLFHYASWKKWSLLRIGFHPVDWKHPAIKAHLLSSVKRAATHRTAMTYGAWMKNNSQG